MQATEEHTWFRSRKNGSLPCAWQGWVAVVVWLALAYGCLEVFSGHPWRILASILLLAAGFNVLLQKRAQSAVAVEAPDQPTPGSVATTTVESASTRRPVNAPVARPLHGRFAPANDASPGGPSDGH
jgi:hypothetical protein